MTHLIIVLLMLLALTFGAAGMNEGPDPTGMIEDSDPVGYCLVGSSDCPAD